MPRREALNDRQRGRQLELAAVRLACEPVQLRYDGVTSERGTWLDRGFCPTCGSPMTVRPEARPNLPYVQAGSLDDPSLYKPTAQIWGPEHPALGSPKSWRSALLHPTNVATKSYAKRLTSHIDMWLLWFGLDLAELLR